ncbi:hypothetical protein F9C11_07745 [Amycolatopsis sp. VS8301801F10]|uniref:hypothetical protein n=1 Tax=Amycolatopsis sp. VS8301801F10 TaxID=2652442 RepID=UPI0038FCA352
MSKIMAVAIAAASVSALSLLTVPSASAITSSSIPFNFSYGPAMGDMWSREFHPASDGRVCVAITNSSNSALTIRPYRVLPGPIPDQPAGPAKYYPAADGHAHSFCWTGFDPSHDYELYFSGGYLRGTGRVYH